MVKDLFVVLSELNWNFILAT